MTTSLPHNWKVVYPDDVTSEARAIVSGPFGSNIGKRFFVESGIPVIRGNNLSLGIKKFINEGFVFLTEEKAEEFKNCQAVTGDIIFTAAGTLGQVGIIPSNSEYPVYIISNKQLRLRPDIKKADSNYLYYWFSSEKIRNHIIGLNTGSSVPLITLGKLRSIPINLPPLYTQRKIAAILSAYDDLIENNLRRIKILEEIAQSLYTEWFVKFRFPGHENVGLVESSPLGRIPEEWEINNLADVCDLVMGQSPSSDFYNTSGEGLPFHQGVTYFGAFFPTDQVYCTSFNRIAIKGDILFSVRAPVGRINLANKKIVIGRGLSAIRNKHGYQAFTYFQLKDKFKEEDSMGGGTIFKAVTKTDMENIKLLISPKLLVSKFENITSTIMSELGLLTTKNEVLRSTRDLLLPKLISGELDVSDLDIKTGEEN
jgi:type I restriction enzyme, S subunit